MNPSDETTRDDDSEGYWCPRCGAEVTSRHLGATLVVRCTTGDWEVATTSPGFGIGDQVTYSLFVTHGDPGRSEQIAALAEVAEVSADMARQVLADATRPNYSGLVLVGDAGTIRAGRAKLTSASIESFADPYLD